MVVPAQYQPRLYSTPPQTALDPGPCPLTALPVLQASVAAWQSAASLLQELHQEDAPPPPLWLGAPAQPLPQQQWAPQQQPQLLQPQLLQLQLLPSPEQQEEKRQVPAWKHALPVEVSSPERSLALPAPPTASAGGHCIHS